MQPLHCEMTWEDFRDFPRQLGWRHEYHGGKIHVTPAHVVITLVLPLTPREVPDVLCLKSVEPEDEARILPIFLDAFAGSMDYAGCTEDELHKAAVRYFKGYFGTVRGQKMSASCIAEENRAIVGAALIKKLSRGPLLDCLFVTPLHQRGGIATALVGHSVNQLLADGERELYSLCVLGNAASLDWHRQFGFRELPDLLVASHRANLVRDELDRHRRLNDLSPDELAALAAETKHWANERARLQTLADTDFWAVHPRLED